MEKQDAKDVSPPPRRVDRVLLLLLTFFLGWLGGHRYYLRRYAQGAVYPAAFFLLFASVLIALVEFVIYLFASEDKLNEWYGETYSSPPSKKSIAIAVAIFVFYGLIVGGVVIPAYQDSIDRSRVAQSLGAAKPWQEAVDGVFAQSRRLASGLHEFDAGFVAPPAADANGFSAVKLGPGGVITVTLSAKTGDLAGKTVVFKPLASSQDGALKWDCTGGTLEPRLRRSSCRAD